MGEEYRVGFIKELIDVKNNQLDVDGFNKDELDDFEALLEVGDPIIYAWVMEKEPVPVQYDTRVFQLIKKFNKDREIIENIKNTIKLRLKKNFKII